MNDGNLKRPSSEEARELGRRGGIASGIARRRRKALREAADIFLALPLPDKDEVKRLRKLGLDRDDIDVQMGIVARLAQMAMLGDTKAAKLLFDIVGPEPETNYLDATNDDPITQSLNEEFGDGTF